MPALPPPCRLLLAAAMPLRQLTSAAKIIRCCRRHGFFAAAIVFIFVRFDAAATLVHLPVPGCRPSAAITPLAAFRHCRPLDSPPRHCRHRHYAWLR